MRSPPSTDAPAARSRLTLFGPVPFYDLLRTGRRRRYVAVRGLYAVFLAAALFCVYVWWFLDRTNPLKEIFVGAPLPAADLADFAASFFYCFILIQLLVVFLLTPAYCAGVLAEEKERHTLEALLATDLSGREIVLGLFLSRLANVALLVATGLPILSLLQFAGGVEPRLVLASFAFTGLTMFSLAGLSVLHSILARRPRDAIIRTYLTVLAYLAVSGLSWLLLVPAWDLAGFPSTENWLSPFTLQDAVEWFNIGNLIAILVQLVLDVQSGATFDAVLPGYLRDYAWFHGLVAVGSCAWAMARLRATALASDTTVPVSTGAGSKTRGRRWWHWRSRPRVGAHPMLWKELCVDRGGRRSLIGWLGRGLVLAAILWPAIALFSFFDRLVPNGPDDHLAELMNLWVRGFGTAIACFMLLHVAVRAAGSLSAEREQQTLDSLLATPLRNRSILFAKWLGSVFSPRPLGLWLGFVWLMGVWTGALHPAAVVVLVVAWMVFAGFLAALGLWFSVASRTTRHATVLTLLALLAVLAAALLASVDLSENLLPERDALCLFPPNALGLVACSPAELNELRERLGPLFVMVLLLWSLGTWVLYRLGNVRFRVLTGRADEAVPDLVAANAASAPPAQEIWFPSAAGCLTKRLVRAALLLAPLCLLAGGHAYLRRGAAERLQEALAEADRFDLGWTLEGLEARREPVPDDQNGARVLLAARGLMPSQWPSSDLSDPKFLDISPLRQLDARQVEALKSNLARADSALAETRRLKDYPKGRFPREAHGNGSVIPHANSTSAAVHGSHLLWYAAHLRVQQLDADGAVEDCLAMVNAARTIGDDALWEAQTNRLEIQSMIVKTVQRVLAQGQPAEAGLAALQRGLEEESEHPIMLCIARGERAVVDRVLAALQMGHSLDLGRYVTMQSGRIRLPSDEEALLLFSGPLKRQRAEALCILNRLVEAAKLPWAEQQAETTAILTQLRGNRQWSALMATSGFRLGWSRKQSLNVLAYLRALAAAVAVERFRLQHHRWPKDLVELGPALLPRVLEDPYDGQPLRFRRFPDGVVIYSVGLDGVDNGGNVNPSVWPPSNDVGVWLWDVQQRRQPPSSAGKQVP